MFSVVCEELVGELTKMHVGLLKFKKLAHSSFLIFKHALNTTFNSKSRAYRTSEVMLRTFLLPMKFDSVASCNKCAMRLLRHVSS
jgi:hypothetical protein